MSVRVEDEARRLVAISRSRLDEISAASDKGDPIRGIINRWYRLLQHDRPRKGRPSFHKLIMADVYSAIELAEDTRSLLGARCPGWAGEAVQKNAERPQTEAEAAVVRPEDGARPLVLALLLNKVANSQAPNRAYEREAEHVLSTIWERLQEIAAADDGDSSFHDIVDQWRKFYELDRPRDRRTSLQQLVKTELDFAIALAELTEMALRFRRPEGA